MISVAIASKGLNMKPVFNVDEPVITCDTGSPEYDGIETRIYAVIPKGMRYECRLTGAMCSMSEFESESFGYLLDIPCRDDDSENGYEILWRSSALRKKPKAADRSFCEIIEDLKQKSDTTQ